MHHKLSDGVHDIEEIKQMYKKTPDTLRPNVWNAIQAKKDYTHESQDP